MALTELSDEELALALKAGSDPAFDELVRRHQGRVYAVAYRLTSNRDDALDVAQEALVKAYRKVGMWEPRSGFVPWLLRLTANQAIDLLRKRRRRQAKPLDELKSAERDTTEPASLDTERQVRANEIDARVQSALDVLSPAQRAVFVCEPKHTFGFTA